MFIDEKGYIKITEFEPLRRNHGGDTLTESHLYLAPEKILEQNYGNAADWWALGCLIYELVAGLPPFYAEPTLSYMA